MIGSSIFNQAAEVAFRHRALWLMGFLASLGGMGLSAFGGGGSSPRRAGQSPNTFNPTADAPIVQLWEQLSERPEMQPVLLSILCLAGLAALAAFLLSIAGRGGLIGGIELASEKGSVTVGDAWAAGTQFYGRLLAARLMLYAPIVLGGSALACLAVPSALIPLALLVCILPLLCLLQAYALVASLVATLAERGIVMDDMGPADAYRHAAALLRANLARIAGPVAILLLARLFFGLAALVMLGLGIVPAFVALNPEDPNWLLLAGTAAAFMCLFPLTAAFNGAVATWDAASWNLLYRSLTGPRPAAMPSPYDN